MTAQLAPVPEPELADKAHNVIAAIARVRRDLPGIGKNQQAAAQQGGYSYRGIEDITEAIGPLLGKHCVVFVPHVVKQRTEQITVANKPWTDTFLDVEYTVYGPGGVEDSITAGPFTAIGRDNTDKGTNKCMTQAYKQALVQVFCIGDSKHDGDSSGQEADARQEDDPEQWYRDNGWADGQVAHAAYRQESLAIRDALTDDQRERYRKWAQAEGHAFNRDNPRAEAEAMRAKLVELRDEKPEQDAPKMTEAEAAVVIDHVPSLSDDERPF